MCALKTEYCVEIRVPKENGKHKFGSGYTLGPNWVLTAYHVLFGKEVDAARPLKITWRDTWGEETGNGKEGGQSLFLVNRDHIVWHHKGHDIALIHFDPPYRNVPGAWSLMIEKRLDGKPSWESLGFLSNLADEQEERRRVNPDGKLGRSGKELTVDLYVDRPNQDLSVIGTSKYWEGFSGSPVFVEGKLIAVVRAVNTGENTLTASFISTALNTVGEGKGQPKLRKVPGFLTSPGRQKCWERIREQVTKTIQDAPNVYNALKNDYLNTINQQQEIKNAEKLLTCLYDTEDTHVISSFLRVVMALRKQEQRGDVLVIKDLACVWSVLMAADQGDICEIESFKNNSSSHSVELKAVEPVLLDVEAQIANAENRKPHLHLIGEHLRSPFDLTPGSRTGFDENNKQTAKDTAGKYLRKTRPGFEIFEIEEAKDALEEFATRPETGLTSPLCPDNDLQRGIEIGNQLEWACVELEGELEEKVSYYIRLPEPISPDSCLAALHTWCPQLLVFAVSMTESPERKQCLSGLHRIIHHAETFLNDHSEEL